MPDDQGFEETDNIMNMCDSDSCDWVMNCTQCQAATRAVHIIHRKRNSNSKPVSGKEFCQSLCVCSLTNLAK